MYDFLQMSLAGSGMILTTALLRRILGNRLPRAAYLLLWGCTMIRMLVPNAFASPWSIFGSLPAPEPSVILMTGAVPSASPSAASVFPAVWLCGMLLCTLKFLFREIRARNALRHAQPVDSPMAHMLLTQSGIRRRVRIRTHKNVRSPLTYGVLRPVIVLPEAEMADASLRFALLHELCHIRRCDCLWKHLAALAACIHWFNPCAWLLLTLLDRDLEISCDMQVLRRCTGDHRAEYAHILLDFAAQALSSAPLANHLSQTPLEERIQMMMTTRKTSIAGIALATALVLGTTSAFAASKDAVAPKPEQGLSVTTESGANVNTGAETAVTESTISVAYNDGQEIRLSPADGVLQEDGSYLYTLPDGSECRVYLAEVTTPAESK
ncbi:MAG: M56 family metallopeptidase [Butyricicoccus pullicaecorum]|nr:M56 family metallopeptidase [Butyricicoccus pullicaecorum]